MPEQRNISSLLLPLEQLLDELAAAGFARDRLGARLRLRVTELLNYVNDDVSREDMKYKLAALICQSEKEQLDFYKAFDAFSERFRLQDNVEAVTPPEKADEPAPGPEPLPPPKPELPKTPPPETRQGSHQTDSVKALRTGPITVELNFRDDGYRPWNLPELESVVRPMREKEWTGAEEWDIPNTIAKSIRSGGAPHFVRRRRRKAPQYLFLIEQKSVRDHLAGFYADLVSELSRRDLDAEFYFYDRIPRQCWKDRRDPSTYTSIDRLNAMYQLSRLILIGEGEGLLAVSQEPGANAEKSSTKIHLYPSELAFQLRDDWPAVALLNTRSTGLWGEVETALHQLFPVAPANVAGLGSLMEQWKNRTSYQPYFWKLENPEPVQPSFINYDGDAKTLEQGIKNLKIYLGRQGYTWLCAISVYPEIYWQLTKLLHDEAISQEDVPDESLRTQLWHLFLLRLSRLDWLRRGHIPPEYRNELRKGLPEANAAEVRRQLLEVLQLHENKPPEGSYAEKDRAYTVALFDHERYVLLEKPDDIRLAAMQEKLRQQVDAAGVAASDIEDAVGRSLFRSLPETAAETVKHFWVLWVDDSPKNNEGFQAEIAKEIAIRFVNVTNTTEAINSLQSQTFDLIISDVSRHRDKEAGIKMIHRFRESGITQQVLFFTHPNYVSQHREMLLGLGAVDVTSGFEVLKPKLLEAVAQKQADNEGSLGKISFLEEAKALGKAVCRVVMADGKRYATGFLTKGNYLFTCYHLLNAQEDQSSVDHKEELRNARLEFNFELDESGNARQKVIYQLDPEDFIFSPAGELDFMRIKVIDRSDAPLGQWGYIDFETSALPVEGDPVCIIHHGLGKEKQRELNTVIGVEGSYLYYEEDAISIPGGTGAPVLNRQLKAVAMHHARIDSRTILGKTRTARQAVLFRDIQASFQRIIFGLKVRQSRTEHGWNFEDLSLKTGISISYLNEIEKGKKFPQPDNRQKLADALGLSIEFLMSPDLTKPFVSQEKETQGNTEDPNTGVSDQADALLKKGTEAHKNKDFISAESDLREALRLYQEIEHETGPANTQEELGKLLLETNRLKEAKQVLQQALSTYTRLDFQAAQAFVLMDLGMIETKMAQLDAAEKNYNEALEQLEGLSGDAEEEIVTVLIALGDVARKKELPREAYSRVLKALEKAKSNNLTKQELLALNQLGELALEIGDTTQAIAHFESAISLAVELRLPEIQASAHENLAKAAHQQGHNELAFVHLDEASRLYAQLDDDNGNARIGDLRRAWQAQTQSYQQNAPAEPPMQSLFTPNNTKFFILNTPADREYADGLARHLLRLEGSDKFSIISLLQTPPGEDMITRGRFEMEQADYVFVLLSPYMLSDDVSWVLAEDSQGLAKELIPVLVSLTDLTGTGFERRETLPKGSRNTTIRQFEDTEDAFFVIRGNVEEILKAKSSSGNNSEETIPNQIKNLIEQGKVVEALDLLQKALPEENEIILLQGRMNQLGKDLGLGVINDEIYLVERAKISSVLLELATKLPNGEAAINEPPITKAPQAKKKLQKKAPPAQQKNIKK